MNQPRTPDGSWPTLIAAAGAVIGNGLITYPLSRHAYARAKQHNARGWTMLFSGPPLPASATSVTT